MRVMRMGVTAWEDFGAVGFCPAPLEMRCSQWQVDRRRGVQGLRQRSADDGHVELWLGLECRRPRRFRVKWRLRTQDRGEQRRHAYISFVDNGDSQKISVMSYSGSWNFGRLGVLFVSLLPRLLVGVRLRRYALCRLQCTRGKRQVPCGSSTAHGKFSGTSRFSSSSASETVIALIPDPPAMPLSATSTSVPDNGSPCNRSSRVEHNEFKGRVCTASHSTQHLVPPHSHPWPYVASADRARLWSRLRRVPSTLPGPR